jgi:uncharacterized protein YggT (Ycf19 family)
MPDNTDNILVIDESKQISQHEAVKGAVRNEVHAQIEDKANQFSQTEQSEVTSVAAKLKQGTIKEIGNTEVDLGRAKVAARTSQIIDYIFYLIYGVIGLQILLDLVGASNSNGFKRFLNVISFPFLAPFHKILPNPSIGRFSFMISYIVAIVIYVLLHLAINGLLRMLVHKKNAI